MKVRLLRDTNVRHKAGEVVEITDPAVMANLFSSRSAEVLRAEAPETPEAKAEKTTARKTAARKK